MTRSILLYGDVNANYRDGSRVWLESIAEVLARTGSHVTLLLKAMPSDGTLAFGGDLPCTIVEPAPGHRSIGAGMTVGEARAQIVELDAQEHFDVVLTRGFAIANELSTVPELAGRLWPYITDGPGFDAFSDDAAEDLARISLTARRVLVQTEDARSVWESRAPAATGKTLLLPPMVPDDGFADATGGRVLEAGQRGTSEAPLRLVYSGKFARAWKSLEMPLLPERLMERGVESRITMIGDKVHHSPQDRPFPAAMQAVMREERARVEWAGGVERAEALRLAAQHDVGLCWRDASLDASLEVSTKLLEFAALGVAPIVNRTRAHERMLGADYPLFVDSDIEATLVAACDPHTRSAAADRARIAVEPHRVSRCVERLARYFAAAEPDLAESPLLPSPHEGRRLRVLFSSHDFKFAGELIDVLEQRGDIELRIDTWNRLAEHDAEASAADGDWADVIICEWAGHNAVFHSGRKRPDQRLIVRFHGFEIRGGWLQNIVVDAVDAFVFVSDFYRREILLKTGWPESRTTVIPNVVDTLDLDREKLPDARFHLGMAGYVPMLKRPDRALDLLERLIAEDDRFILHLRGRSPWSYPWEWAKPMQRNAYEAMFERLRQSDRLRDRVLFEEFGPDMGSWFRGIGWTLSPSTRETFHLAPVEGMASGAIPIVWSRPGAQEVFGDALFDDVDAMAQSILQTVREPGAFARRSLAAKEAAQAFDMAQHRAAWLDLLDAERSTPLPRRGIALADNVPAEGPSSAAEVAALVERALEADDASRARELLSLPAAHATDGSHVGSRLREMRERALLLDGLRSGRWIPNDDLGPVYLPARAPRSDGSAPVLESEAIVGEVALAATPILTAADALVTAARRFRPSQIVAPAAAGGVIAATIAARRLGVELIVPPTGREAVASAELELPGLAAALRGGDAGASTPIELRDLTVGLVADDFTTRAVSSAVRTVAIPRDGWRNVLDDAAVDVILVESAWSSPGQAWFQGVAFHGDAAAADLRAILAYARERGVPTLFWNREDPVHQRSFRIPAADFDAVLTTDADCIPAYLATSPSRTAVAASLPFFADPSVMFPTDAEGVEADARIAYAGTYYGARYPKRTEELRGILDVAADFGLAIYDRQATLDASPYRLPDELLPYSRGGVSAAEMPDVYRRHPVHLNVNSVTDSPTMFSRRVVEIASSGSLVLSGSGDAVRGVLGSAFPVVEGREAWRDSLSAMLGDGDAWREAVWAQLRTVRRSFTSQRSLALALRVAGLPVRAPREPRYAVLVPNSFHGAADLLLAQTLLPSAVAISEDHPDLERLSAVGIATVPLDVAARDLSELVSDEGYVGVLAPGLDATHYEDLLLATSSGDWERIVAREPESEAEELSIVADSGPSSDDVVGALYARSVVHEARDLASGQSLRTFVWIRGPVRATDPFGGD